MNIVTEHPNFNFTFYAPKGHETHVVDLKVHRYYHDTLGTCCRSYWKPTQEELTKLMDGGMISLDMFQAQMCVVSVGVTK